MIDVLVIGAGPYGLAAARAIKALGLTTTVVGQPMGFWREHMPQGMLLRSGPDWHMDPQDEYTFEAFCDDPPDPIPLDLFLDYAEWFQDRANIVVEDDEVVQLKPGWEAWMRSGRRLKARNVVAAPGVAYFTHRPEWASAGAHTCDVIDFKDLAGAHVVIVGGRQSAYEWAALIHEQGAERVDVVHRHAPPRFDRVSWRFLDRHIDDTLAHAGWWRRLPEAERARIERQFWEVGRLTLEHWLEPRIAGVHVHANAEIVSATPGTVTLSEQTRLPFDRIVLATGYEVDLARVPYLPPLPTPTLDDHMQSCLPGLYLPGFTATNDFGPFFGFVKGAPAAAKLIAADVSERT